MRSNRSSPVAPVAAEGTAAMTMAQMAEMMRSLQATVEASRMEQASMHEYLVASRARNEELSKVTEELRQALQEQWWLFTASAPRLSEVIIVPKDGYWSYKEQWIIKYNNR